MDPQNEFPRPYQRRMLWNAITVLSVAAILTVAVYVFREIVVFLSWSYPILLPIGLAVIVALVLDPFVNFAQRRGLSRGISTLLVCVLAVIATLVFWAFLGQALVSETGGFFKSLPNVLSTGLTKLQATVVHPHTETLEADATLTSTATFTPKKESSELPATPALAYHMDTNAPPVSVIYSKDAAGTSAESKPSTDTSEIQAWLAGNLPAIQATIQKNVINMIYSALGPVGQAFGFILGFGFVPIYVYYFLADQDQISKHWHDFVPLRRSALRNEVVSVLVEINTSLVGYFRGQIVVAACNGLLTFIGLGILQIPYSLVLGIITGALSIVPFLGIIASIIPALLLGFLSAKGDPTWQWLTPLLVIVVFAVVQMCESMFITPRVQSHSTGLHPLAIIFGILFWSLLLPGLLGPVVAVPLTCAVVVLMRRYVWQEKFPSLDSAPAEEKAPPTA
jgi:predicted PurR-regulated permease PerM